MSWRGSIGVAVVAIGLVGLSSHAFATVTVRVGGAVRKHSGDQACRFVTLTRLSAALDVRVSQAVGFNFDSGSASQVSDSFGCSWKLANPAQGGILDGQGSSTPIVFQAEEGVLVTKASPSGYTNCVSLDNISIRLHSRLAPNPGCILKVSGSTLGGGYTVVGEHAGYTAIFEVNTRGITVPRAVAVWHLLSAKL